MNLLAGLRNRFAVALAGIVYATPGGAALVPAHTSSAPTAEAAKKKRGKSAAK
jgi:hypothetical protein